MKKLKRKEKEFWINRNRKIKCDELRKARGKTHKRKKESIRNRRKLYENELKKARLRILKRIQKSTNFIREEKEIIVNEEFGIEDYEYVDSFLEIASEIIDFNACRLKINIANCSRVWPSAVTLLCSLMRWVESASKNNYVDPPIISSNDSKHEPVNSYLQYCGFYRYVDREKHKVSHAFEEQDIIKIKREKSQKHIEKRENEICNLIKRRTNYSDDDIELFNSIILTEVFLNVNEHGFFTGADEGWWILAQYHKIHKMISLNIADNGIGIRHSLVTGPQKEEILANIENKKENDGEFIKLAMEQNVSGAVDASNKEGFIFKNYKRGSRRGNGLERICKTCDELNIGFTILSHHGCTIREPSGKIVRTESRPSRVFAGTLYHFNIPASE